MKGRRFPFTALIRWNTCIYVVSVKGERKNRSSSFGAYLRTLHIIRPGIEEGQTHRPPNQKPIVFPTKTHRPPIKKTLPSHLNLIAIPSKPHRQPIQTSDSTAVCTISSAVWTLHRYPMDFISFPHTFYMPIVDVFRPSLSFSLHIWTETELIK